MAGTNSIKVIRERQGLSRSALATLANTSQQQIARLENGDRRLTLDWADRLAAALSVTSADILGLDLRRAYWGPDTEPLDSVPLIGQVSCGNWQEAIETPLGHVPSMSGGPATFALKARGDSMDKLVPDGGIVGVDPDDTDLHDGRVYIVMNEAGETTAKRYRANPARLVPESLNPEHVPISIGRDPFRVIGRAVWMLAEL